MYNDVSQPPNSFGYNVSYPLESLIEPLFLHSIKFGTTIPIGKNAPVAILFVSLRALFTPEELLLAAFKILVVGWLNFQCTVDNMG